MNNSRFKSLLHYNFVRYSDPQVKDVKRHFNDN
jgi:hypothetical protein